MENKRKTKRDKKHRKKELFGKNTNRGLRIKESKINNIKKKNKFK